MTQAITHPNISRSGLTSLVNLAAHYGTRADVAAYMPLTGGLTEPTELFEVIFLAKQIGMNAIPMEGPFSALPECPFPVMVPLTTDERRYVVVLGVDEETVPILDPVQGARDLSHDAFRKQWENEEGHGDVLAISPGERFPDLARRLEKGKSPLYRMRWRTGLVPPWPKKLAFGAISLTVILVAIFLPQQPALLTALCLGFALIGSLWSTMFGGSCASCHGAAKLAGGLPLGPLGILGYGVLLIFWAMEKPIAWHLIFVAAGCHLALVGTLIKARLMCGACIFTALSIWSALGTGFPGQETTSTHFAFLLGAIIVCWLVLIHARHNMRNAHFKGAFDLAQTIWVEEQPAEGQVRVVVYKRKDCSYCLLYEASIKPALEQEFGEMLVFEEREMVNEPIDVPLMICHGQKPALVMDLRSDDAYTNAREAVMIAANLAAESQRSVTAVLPS